jgi:uncharacterized protein (TIGR02444 family)
MSDFWRWSLRAWSRPAVARACLDLQQRSGADANLLLFCCWLGEAGRSADARLLRRAIGRVSGWRREVTEPLRSVRGAIKSGVRGIPPKLGAQVRRRVLSAELDAERAEQLVLAALADDAPRRRAEGTAGGNLARYLSLLKSPPGPASSALLSALGENA